MRFVAVIEYDGSAYNGWQKQPHAPSVQAVVESAISRVADHTVSVVCAGRTDTGVHACGQVIHFDAEVDRGSKGWVRGINTHLPRGVSCLGCGVIKDDFHARFSALSRSYRYIILNRKVRPALLHARVSWQYRELDHTLMQNEASALIGEHDFTSYRALACQAKTAVRTIRSLVVRRSGEFILIDVTANAFLHHMVRNIVGNLMEVGFGKRQSGWCGALLEQRDRSAGGVTAPPDGLYFVDVDYPAHYVLPARSAAIEFGSEDL